MITLSLNTDKLDPKYYVKTDEAIYVNFRMRKHERDQYNNDYMITQGVSAEAYKEDKKGGEILGNARIWQGKHEAPIILATIQRGKIDPKRMVKGAKGNYLNLYLTKAPASGVEADYIVRQSITKDERMQGKTGREVGVAWNKEYAPREESESAPAVTAEAPVGNQGQESFNDEDIPF